MQPTTRISPDALRVFVYDRIIDGGSVPSSNDIAQRFGVTADDARAELASLKIGKTVLVDPTSGEIWMAGPFSRTETAYRVRGGAQAWWANCAWDMFGIATLVNTTVRASTRCLDCGKTLEMDCDPHHPPQTDWVVHFQVPAARWYDDIGFT